MQKNTLAKRAIGRPAHKPTPATRRQVSIAAGGGMRHEDISLALGITRETLRKWYLAELTVVATMRRMEVMQALHVAAKKGSSSAAKAYLAANPQYETPPDGAGDWMGAKPPVADSVPAGKPAAPLGKKEQAQADAVTAGAGTEWDSLLRPPANTPVQ